MCPCAGMLGLVNPAQPEQETGRQRPDAVLIFAVLLVLAVNAVASFAYIGF